MEEEQNIEINDPKNINFLEFSSKAGQDYNQMRLKSSVKDPGVCIRLHSEYDMDKVSELMKGHQHCPEALEQDGTYLYCVGELSEEEKEILQDEINTKYQDQSPVVENEQIADGED